MYVNGFVDVSCGNVLLRAGPAPNHLILQNGDISLNGRLFTSGNVGIGTTNPSQLLEVYKNGGVGGTTQVNITSVAGGVTTTNTAVLDLRIQGAGGGMVDNTITGQCFSGTYGLAMNPYGTNVMNLLGSGYVGIGTTNPQAALDVSGAIRVSGGITPTYSAPSFTSGQVGYVQTGTFNTTTTYSTGWQTICTIVVVNPGIYLLSGTASSLAAQSGGYIGCGLTSGDYSDYSMQCYGSRVAISGVVTVSAANTSVYLSYYFLTSSQLDGNHLLFRATRIA